MLYINRVEDDPNTHKLYKYNFSVSKPNKYTKDTNKNNNLKNTPQTNIQSLVISSNEY